MAGEHPSDRLSRSGGPIEPHPQPSSNGTQRFPSTTTCRRPSGVCSSILSTPTQSPSMDVPFTSLIRTSSSVASTLAVRSSAAQVVASSRVPGSDSIIASGVTSSDPQAQRPMASSTAAAVLNGPLLPVIVGALRSLVSNSRGGAATAPRLVSRPRGRLGPVFGAA